MANPMDTVSRGSRPAHASLASRARDVRGIGVETPTAYELYFGAPRVQMPQHQQREDAFFRSLWVRHGTSKQTYRHRFDDLNQLLERLLPPERPLDIMDVAVSSGVCTLEWSQSLTRAGMDHRMVASDAVIEADLISFGGFLRALVDRTGFLMQLEFRGRAVSVSRRHSLGRLRFLPFIVLARTARHFAAPDMSAPDSPAERVRRPLLSRRALKLVSRSLLEEPRVEVIEDDIRLTGDIGRRFHAIRAANILNRLYFDPATLGRMVVNLRARLRPGGLFAVCRTLPDGHNEATVFRLEDRGGLSVVSRLNGGSEIEDIVLASNAHPESAR